MDELYAGFHALRMEVRSIGSTVQEHQSSFEAHRRSCAMRWEDQDRQRAADEARWAADAQRRVVEDQRWQSLEAYMYRGAQGPSSSSQYQSFDPAGRWSGHDGPSAPQ